MTMAAKAIKPRFFATPSEFRRWLETHHADTPELWVGFYKKDSGLRSITWPESVDEALCVGWIDGLRKRVDEHSYMIRFTPRKAVSIWSAVNTKRAQQLIGEGRMRPAGLSAFEGRDPKRTNLYSFEQRHAARFDPALERRFKSNARAWAFFQSQPDGYRRVATFYVMSARQEATRLRRLDTLIRDSAAGLRIGLLRRTPAP
jgi:uncharacterized protein YdeI (YjbR/CyaY-like superfamily)